MPDIVTINPGDVGLGRLPAHGLGVDKDAQYPIRALFAAEPPPPPRTHTWAMFERCLDQGQTGTCVAHALRHLQAAGPRITARVAQRPTALEMYRQIVTRDEWTENDAEATAPDSGLQFGTSVRAAFDWMLEKGAIDSYHWATSLEDMVVWVGHRGPMEIGVPMYTGMFNPDAKGHLNLTGAVEGGHAMCVIGVNITRRDFTVVNSWGRWGINGTGRARIRWDDMARLIFDEHGEAACGLELRPVRLT